MGQVDEEYLLQLTTRKKWVTQANRPMAVGDLVWLCDKQYHPFSYPMGRILELNFSDDEVSKSATVKTSRKIFERPLVNLVPRAVDRKGLYLATINKASDVAVEDSKTLKGTKLFLVVKTSEIPT